MIERKATVLCDCGGCSAEGEAIVGERGEVKALPVGWIMASTVLNLGNGSDTKLESFIVSGEFCCKGHLIDYLRGNV